MMIDVFLSNRVFINFSPLNLPYKPINKMYREEPEKTNVDFCLCLAINMDNA